MDTKKLDIFLKVVEIGSLKKAAEDLNYTQSGLLYLMNSLEGEMKVSLLRRSPKGVSLSPEGEQLLPYIKSVVYYGRALAQEAAKIQERTSRKIRLATYPIYARYYLADVVKKFLEDHPEESISINVGMEKELHEWLENGEVDLAVGESGEQHGEHWIPLMQDELYAAVPHEFHVSLTDERFTLEQLGMHKILYSGYLPVELTDKLLEYSEGEGIPLQIEMKSLDGSALLAMVERGMGIAFLSGLYRFECPLSVEMYPLDPPVYRTLGVLVRNGARPSGSVAKFISYLEHFKEPENDKKE